MAGSTTEQFQSPPRRCADAPVVISEPPSPVVVAGRRHGRSSRAAGRRRGVTPSDGQPDPELLGSSAASWPRIAPLGPPRLRPGVDAELGSQHRVQPPIGRLQRIAGRVQADCQAPGPRPALRDHRCRPGFRSNADLRRPRLVSWPAAAAWPIATPAGDLTPVVRTDPQRRSGRHRALPELADELGRPGDEPGGHRLRARSEPMAAHRLRRRAPAALTPHVAGRAVVPGAGRVPPSSSVSRRACGWPAASLDTASMCWKIRYSGRSDPASIMPWPVVGTDHRW